MVRECDKCDRFSDPERECMFYETGAYCKYQEPPYRGPDWVAGLVEEEADG